MNLLEKVRATEPGRLAYEIADVVYETGAIDDKQAKRLYAVRDYLEALAFKQVEAEVPEWVTELQKRKAAGNG